MKQSVFLSLFICLFALAGRAQTSNTGTLSKVIVNNNKVKVTEYTGNPGKGVCGVGKHSHPAHLTVLLTDASVTITTANGKTITRKVPAGTTFWSEAETHEVINNGNMPVRSLIIETKK